MTESNRTQLENLEHFALSNDVQTIGGRNYSFDRNKTFVNSLVDVPLPINDFAETALVYSALIGEAPTNAEVAKLTFTSDYQVRPFEERVGMILDNGLFGKSFWNSAGCC